MFRVAVCEDDPEVLSQIRQMLGEYTKETLTVTAYQEAADLLDEWKKAGKPLQDILLMDIKFKDEDGIRVVGQLQEFFGQTCVVFITGFAEYAERAIETQPIHYLIKPVTAQRFYAALDKAAGWIRKQEGMGVALPVKGGIVRLAFRDILYIESNLRVLEIHGGTQVWTVKMQFGELMEKLPPQFVRVHQSFVVNLDGVTAFKGHKISLSGGVEVPVSRVRYEEAKERFMRYLRGTVV